MFKKLLKPRKKTQERVQCKVSVSVFQSAPHQPGVYWFSSQKAGLLYVGKAKNLRNRLSHYKNASTKRTSRKILRMLKLADSLEWKCCESELCALLCENKMLREKKPPFNIMNTRPEGYYFIGLKVVAGTSLEIILTTRSKIEGFELFGAFKNRSDMRDGFKAFLRLFWLSQVGFRLYQPSTVVRKIPSALLKRDPIYKYEFHFADSNLIHFKLKDFFSGKDRSLLDWLFDDLLSKPQMPKFFNMLISEDFQVLSEFFERGPKRNYTLLQNSNGAELESSYIAQDRLDDLLVKHYLKP